MAIKTVTRRLVLLACAMGLAGCGGTAGHSASPPPASPAPNPYQAHVRPSSYAIHLTAATSTTADQSSAVASITITAPGDQLCWTITHLAGVPAPLFAYIHRGLPRTNGPVVVPLGTRYRPVGCVDGIAPALLTQIETHPATYYLAIHTRARPLGAIRAQL